LERDKAYDNNLNALFTMWRKEKGLMANAAKQYGPRNPDTPDFSAPRRAHGGSRSSSKKLPPPVELAGRIEEARTSAKLLLQLVQSTPANELLGNDLVKEFAERCTAAQRSIHGYIACDDPAPDDDTMLTLIETNEQLSLAASKHQRAMLQSRRLVGATSSPPVPAQNGSTSPSGVPQQSYPQPYTPPALSPGNAATTESYQAPPGPPPQQTAPPEQPQSPHEENPFADHYSSAHTPPPQNPMSNTNYGASPDSYHPGFQSTPSYLNRQESSANNLTMHGAQVPIAEQDESARPRTPDYAARQHAPDVSPVAERNTVTYRY
jgi:hypothetical protein